MSFSAFIVGVSPTGPFAERDTLEMRSRLKRGWLPQVYYPGDNRYLTVAVLYANNPKSLDGRQAEGSLSASTVW
jgi:hypothetical protein